MIRHLFVLPLVAGDEDARHATAAELALEDVCVREVGLEVGEQVGHRVQHTRGTLGVNAVAGGCRLGRTWPAWSALRSARNEPELRMKNLGKPQRPEVVGENK